MAGLLTNLRGAALVISIVPLIVSCSGQSAVKQGEKAPLADQQVASLSEQYEQNGQESAQKDVLEAQRQLRFLGGRVLYLFPPVLSAFDSKPYSFAVEARSGALKVFVCDSVRDGVVPEDSRCWLSPNQKWEWISIRDVSNNYPKSVSFTVYRSRHGEVEFDESIKQETLFSKENGQIVPSKTYFQVWRQNSGTNPINTHEGVNYVINSGCTVGGNLGSVGSRWIIDGKLVESPNRPQDPMIKEINIDKCLAEAKSSGDY
jgi:hypothetical protein